MNRPNGEPALLTVGRINLDLYSEQLYTPMREATTFRASVGGTPTNVAIVARRLGTPAAVLTATGEDPAGDLVLAQLAATGVDTRWVHRLEAGATSMAMLATVAPDVGQRQYYRGNPADIHLEPAVVTTLPWDTLRVVLLSVDALARGSTPSVLAEVAAEAAERGIPVWWDLDLRESTWPDLATYAATALPYLDNPSVLLGTEAEFASLLQVSASDLNALHYAVRRKRYPCAIVKTGPRGAVLYADGREPLYAPAMPHRLVCTVGGGDALAGGLIHARLSGQDWPEALRFAMRVAGWTVSQPGCSHGFPTLDQLNGPASTTPMVAS